MSRPSQNPEHAATLTTLTVGQPIVYDGDRVARVPEAIAKAFEAGDRILVDTGTGEVLHIPVAQTQIVDDAVSAARRAFAELGSCSDAQITEFFREFADLLADDAVFATIASANASDVERARSRGRSTTRLELTEDMRVGMIAGLLAWADQPGDRTAVESHVGHDKWGLSAVRSPLGVVGFVFEGRPNVFADAVGVLRTGNTVVFRIGSDALGTARAIMDAALDPACRAVGLPAGVVRLVDASSHAAAWALFSDRRLSLAVARGSGPAVAQLGAVARQAGVPVSLHGMGGAWMVAAADAHTSWFAASVEHSLDRKVCNTLNTLCVVRTRAAELIAVAVAAAEAACAGGEYGPKVHLTPAAERFVQPDELRRTTVVGRADGDHTEPMYAQIDERSLGHEWEWERSPEFTVHVVESMADAVACFNAQSPRFVASLISQDPAAHTTFFASIDAPFVGNGFTRWVDGQYALNAPELGLSNWEHGRLLGRGGILSGDSVYTLRYVSAVNDPSVHR